MNKSKWMGVLLVLGAACGPVAPEEASSEQQAVKVDGRTPLTSEQMQALLDRAAKNPPALSTVACQPANACAGYDTCTPFTAFQNCGSLSACDVNGCYKTCVRVGSDTGPIVCYHVGSQSQTSFRYRQCFDNYGNSCTNIELSSATVCGCNDGP